MLITKNVCVLVYQKKFKENFNYSYNHASHMAASAQQEIEYTISQNIKATEACK